MRLCFFFIGLLWITGNVEAQAISYGQNDDFDEDTVKIVRAAPEFIARGYTNFENYLEDQLYRDYRTNISFNAIGATALIKFTIDKNGYPKRVSVDCSETRLILPLLNAVDSMPRWKPGIRNDRPASTRMEFFFRITRVEAGQFVVQKQRKPPELDKTTKPLKIAIMAVSISALIAAWFVF